MDLTHLQLLHEAADKTLRNTCARLGRVMLIRPQISTLEENLTPRIHLPGTDVALVALATSTTKLYLLYSWRYLAHE
jgi:hypothetical protein